MDKQIMVQIDHVSKEYRLGAIGGTTLREDLARLGAKLRKKEDPTLKIGQSNKHYGEKFLALDDVSFSVAEGEAVGIIGHNGAGKSTLLKLISRVTAPTKGQIGLNGRVASMLEVGTGFHPELTGRENIYMNGAILGMKRAEIDSKVEDIIDFSECRQFIDTPVKRYSSGMYVKLAFSVAAHLDSEIMIMDEVLAVGDMRFQNKCLSKMKEIATKEGRTILYVSHNVNTIRKLCTRCVVLEHGIVAYDGDVNTAISHYLGTRATASLRVDCREIPREGIGDNKIHINTVSILNMDSPVLYDNHIMHLNIEYDSKEQFDDLAFRMIVFSSSDVPVGMTSTDGYIKSKQGKNYVDLNLHFDVLAVGQYSGRIVLYEVDEYGSEIVHDVVHHAITFTKENTCNNNTSMVWKPNAWGFIKFDDTQIIRSV